MIRKRRFINLTLANGRMPVVIDPKFIAICMRLSGADDKGNREEFTRIIPDGITIDKESNWLDVLETPEQIAKMQQ